jgi:hypothetical protein
MRVPANTWLAKWKSTFLATAQTLWPATFRHRLKTLAPADTAAACKYHHLFCTAAVYPGPGPGCLNGAF